MNDWVTAANIVRALIAFSVVALLVGQVRVFVAMERGNAQSARQFWYRMWIMLALASVAWQRAKAIWQGAPSSPDTFWPAAFFVMAGIYSNLWASEEERKRRLRRITDGHRHVDRPTGGSATR